MAKRKVRRQARRILGEDPVALVWCEIHKPIPAPPGEVHRAAGKGRMKPGHHWLLYVGGVVFFFVVVPVMLIDRLIDKLERPSRPGPAAAPRAGRPRTPPDPRPSTGDPTTDDPATGNTAGGATGNAPADGVFDGDWNLTAGRLLLRWYGHSPNPKRLVMLAGDRVCVAASPRRRLSPTKADDFRIVAEFSAGEARAEGEAGRPRGFATFRLRFSDGSWLELGRLADPDDADHFLRTISA